MASSSSNSTNGSKPQTAIRLATIKPTRDLTLGFGSTNKDVTRGGMPKRKFVPNIPQLKAKANDQNVSASSSSTMTSSSTTTTTTASSSSTSAKHLHHHKTPPNSRGRGRGRGRGHDLIQLTSIFDEGPMEKSGIKAARSASTLHLSSGNRSSSSSHAQQQSRTKLSNNVKRERKDGEKDDDDDDDDDKALLAELLRDDFIDDDDEDEGGLEKPGKQYPITLPFAGPAKKDFKVELDSLNDVKRKKEVVTDQKCPLDVMDVDKNDQQQTNVANHNQQQPTNVANNLEQNFNKSSNSSANPSTAVNIEDILDLSQLYLVQMPHFLPGFPPSSSSLSPPSTSSSSSSRRPSTSKTGDGGDKTTAPSSENNSQGGTFLKDFSEGYIGKLRIRKSGKMEIVLGNILLDGDKELPAPYLQEAVLIDRTHDPNRFIRLGTINEQITFMPNISSLLQQAETEKSRKS